MSIAEELAAKHLNAWNDEGRLHILDHVESAINEALELAAQALEDHYSRCDECCSETINVVRALKSPAGPVQPSQEHDEHS